MKTTASLTLFLCLMCSAALAAEPTTKLDDGSMKAVMGDLLNTGKGILSELDKNLGNTKQDPPAPDNMTVVATNEEFAKVAKVSVLKVEEPTRGQVTATLAIANETDAPIRITNLSQLGAVILLDSDSFAYPLSEPSLAEDVVVLPQSKTRARFTFTGIEGKPARVRFMGAEAKI
ncbi:hypothetical protein [Desulfovibrio cuneatus]|uniref:hypothetical protein n=1 Tax=Desulfovibrio cuneatus TaxID=159728 RepID=UPI0003F7EC57|nr:hypothetical protein [Desulfovibrio cuneatus]